MYKNLLLAFVILNFANCVSSPPVPGSGSEASDNSPVLGSWNVTVYDINGVYPSWFEISANGDGLSGRFVGRVGNARPLDYVHFDGERLYLSLPRQYEEPMADLIFVGDVRDRKIDGQTRSESGEIIRFQALKAPALVRSNPPEWGETVDLIQPGLSHWTARNPGEGFGWRIENGELINSAPSVDLLTRHKFNDFKLHLEFNLPDSSNSGIYLRARYEVQIEDNYGVAPDSLKAGGVYGFITPKEMAIKPAGQWNSCDITMIGRTVTVVLNDRLIIDKVDIPGITGGALDSREPEPGPLMLQGDHGPIRYRNIRITPAK